MKYIFLQNTITPYRISLFNKLYDLNLDFEVLYMCEQEKDRSWKIDYIKMHFPYIVDKGHYCMFKGVHVHWNPFLIKHIVESDSKVILGGSWNDFNVLMICLLKRLGIIRSELIFWSEANYLTIGARNDNLLKKIIRKFVYKSGEGRIIVPGQMAIDTFDRWHIKVQNFVILPNVIEEDKFKSFLFRKDNLKDRKPIFVLPARIDEKYKGILNFFKAIGIKNIRKSFFPDFVTQKKSIL